MNARLVKAALRYRAIYLDIDADSVSMQSGITAPVRAFTQRLQEHGFAVSERLLHALNSVRTECLVEITEVLNEALGVNLNWTPLVKGWNEPTGESYHDHLFTLFANWCGGEKSNISGTKLPCGCFIPDGSFPLERYNGCPFCGTPFVTSDFVYMGQCSKLKELRLWTPADMRALLLSLLESKTPLDATQRDTLKFLFEEYELPENVRIEMKETAMLVVQHLLKNGRGEKATALMQTPTDILRYLWFEKTGQLQIIEPRTLISHAGSMYRHITPSLDRSYKIGEKMRNHLKLKYDRRTCRAVAQWLNKLPIPARQAAEMMHPKRGMWVRLIRALRLGEYSRKPGMERLAELLDVFYKKDYSVWQGRVDKAWQANSADDTLTLLAQRPGMFARCLFASMLRFGADKVLAVFEGVAEQLPSRLLLSLGNNAELYFQLKGLRVATPVTGAKKTIAKNRLLALYNAADLQAMTQGVEWVYRRCLFNRFAAKPTTAHTVYIDPQLYNIPVSVGERSGLIQDLSCALMGTRFPVEGDAVRMFLQWGKGLHAQHLDMDLSCRFVRRNGTAYVCSYFDLAPPGAKHSGDIRAIPEMVGTAEYIELSLPELEENNVKYAVFTCNAFSGGALSPNLMFGWMDSAYPMQLSEATGVAYDPSCVQHLIRVGEDFIAKGIVCGVLDVEKREIIWLEMASNAQTVLNFNYAAVSALLERLSKKLSIGQVLDMKVRAQQLKTVDAPELADEAYTYEWALNPADVISLVCP